MRFKDAEVLLNCSLLFGKVPIFIVGKNGIGKTEMLEKMSHCFKKSLYVTEFDMGGLTQIIPELMNKGIRTIVLSDVQTILMRKSSVRASTLGKIATLMSEGAQHRLLYSKEGQTIEQLMKKKSKKEIMNFVVAGTSHHYQRIVGLRQYDLLNRMIIVVVERKPDEFNENGFKIDVNIAKNYDKNVYLSYKMTKYKGISPRHNAIINELIRELNSIGIEGESFINMVIPRVFSPKDDHFAGLDNIPIGEPITLQN